MRAGCVSITLCLPGIAFGLNAVVFEHAYAPSDLPAASTRQMTEITKLFYAPTLRSIAFAIVASVFDDDPARSVVVGFLLLDEYVSGVLARAGPDSVVVVITDHTGTIQTVTGATGCALAESEAVISRFVTTGAPTPHWRVQLGMCPAYTDQNPSFSTAMTQIRVYMALIAVVTVISAAVLLAVVHLHQKVRFF